MSTCVFKTKDLKRCVEHALNSPSWNMGYSEHKPQPGLYLVHDDGVYLMSNGEPGDVRKDGELSLYVAYAEGCNPETDADCWENSRALVGGSDFAETIVINADWLTACNEHEELHIRVEPEAIWTRFTNPIAEATA